MTSKVTRIFTGITGLPVSQAPHVELVKIYGKVLRHLEKLPKDTPYRIATEKLISERKNIVETTKEPEEVEKKIGAGLCEELIEQAKLELELIDTMKQFKPWEKIEEKPTPDQWKWPA